MVKFKVQKKEIKTQRYQPIHNRTKEKLNHIKTDQIQIHAPINQKLQPSLIFKHSLSYRIIIDPPQRNISMTMVINSKSTVKK